MLARRAAGSTALAAANGEGTPGPCGGRFPNMEVGCGAPAKLVPAPAATGRGGGGGGGENVLDIDKHAVYSPAIYLLLSLFFFNHQRVLENNNDNKQKQRA